MVTTLRAELKSGNGGATVDKFSHSWINIIIWEKYIETFKPHTIKDAPFILIIDPKNDKQYYSTPVEDDVVKNFFGLMSGISGGSIKPKPKDELWGLISIFPWKNSELADGRIFIFTSMITILAAILANDEKSGW